MVGGGLLIELEAANDADAVLVAQEARLVGEVVHRPEGSGAKDHGHDALEDEDPGPAGLAALTVHEIDGGGQETTEGAGDGGGGEEYGLFDVLVT